MAQGSWLWPRAASPAPVPGALALFFLGDQGFPFDAIGDTLLQKPSLVRFCIFGISMDFVAFQL